jgi:hypothetical protein
MTTPIALDIPHSLGKDTVRQRLDGGIGKIGRLIPGGGQVQHSWDGDTMNFTVAAMGQEMRCAATVSDNNVHAVVDLPPMLALFADKVRSVLGAELPKLIK